MEYEVLSKEDLFEKFDTSVSGLSSSEAEVRIKEYGLNALIEKEKPSEYKKFLSQFTEPLMVLLIIAGFVAFFIQDYIDSAVIFFVVILNAVLGYRQENKAENAMENLKSLTKNTSVVLRDNKKGLINSEELTVGDVVLLEEGDNVPADLQLIEDYDLRVNESSLTGESLPVKKSSDYNPNNSRDNLVFMDTSITNGRGTGVVVATGMNTEIGNIANLIQDDEKETPLQIRIDKLGKTLGLLGVVVCVLIFILELVQGTSVADTFMTAVSLAVAAIPEGLPAVLTLTLALGMQKMAKNNVIVRKLLAVETLGSCSVICTDKTGTLTLNELVVVKDYLTDKEMSYKIGDLCNNSKINTNSNKSIGDPTDIAIKSFSLKNVDKKFDSERLNEYPLDSIRKCMSTINRISDNNVILTKGAPEIIIEKCTHISENGSIKEFTKEDKDKIKKIVEEYTKESLRVIAFAYKRLGENYDDLSLNELESNLIFTGIVGMMDPPRDEIYDSIKTCQNAGITVKMITGDHKNTASAIAKQVGITSPENVLTGDELKNMDEKQLKSVVTDYNVFARVFPEQKLDIVKAIKQSDEIVAMTGDGVNDAPALTRADIGIAMGSGTDVAKKSSDMVLEDDAFSSITYAVKEGRTIYSNIKRFIKFQLSTNIAAILTILISSLMYIPLPFNPAQLLWINIIMDGPPAQSLGVEPSDKEVMSQAPKNDNILSKENLVHILLIGLVMSCGTTLLYLYEVNNGANHILASTVAFTVFVMYQLFNVFNCKSNSDKQNKTLIISVLASFILQVCAVYLPILQSIFKTTALPLESWIYIIIVALMIFVAEKIIVSVEKKIFT